MSQIAGPDRFFSPLKKWGEDSNKTLPFYWNKPLLFGMQFYGLARTVRPNSFHDEIVDRVDMRNPSNVLLDNWAFI
jgi:hypothetical protein